MRNQPGFTSILRNQTKLSVAYALLFLAYHTATGLIGMKNRFVSVSSPSLNNLMTLRITMILQIKIWCTRGKKEQK